MTFQSTNPFAAAAAAPEGGGAPGGAAAGDAGGALGAALAFWHKELKNIRKVSSTDDMQKKCTSCYRS